MGSRKSTRTPIDRVGHFYITPRGGPSQCVREVEPMGRVPDIYIIISITLQSQALLMANAHVRYGTCVCRLYCIYHFRWSPACAHALCAGWVAVSSATSFDVWTPPDPNPG